MHASCCAAAGAQGCQKCDPGQEAPAAAATQCDFCVVLDLGLRLYIQGVAPVLPGIPWQQLWEALSGTNSEKRGVPSRSGGGENSGNALEASNALNYIGFGASQPYSWGKFQETLWERFRGLSGISSGKSQPYWGYGPYIQEWPQQTKPQKGQFMNFSQGHSGTKVRDVNRACFPKKKHQNSHKKGRNSWTFRFGPFFGLVCWGDSWYIPLGTKRLPIYVYSWRILLGNSMCSLCVQEKF